MSSSTRRGAVKHHRRTLAGTAVYILLVILAIICILPLVHCFKVSLEPNANAFLETTLVPHDLTLANYIEIIQRQDLMLPAWFVNSVLVSTTVVVLQLIVVSMAAYAFARLSFPGRNFLFMVVLFTIMVPSQVTMIPAYMIIRNLKLLDNYLGLILPAVGNVFGVFMLRQFLQSLPKELEESALIDGAGQFRTFFAIILPQIKPGLIALGILNFLSSWNDLFWPLIIMNKLEMRTLPVGLTVLNGSYGQERALVMAGAFIAIIPALVIYAVFQRRIVEGVALSGMGGR
jgi:multiple sugar transport system permease protein